MARAWPRPDGAGTRERPDRSRVPAVGVSPVRAPGVGTRGPDMRRPTSRRGTAWSPSTARGRQVRTRRACCSSTTTSTSPGWEQHEHKAFTEFIERTDHGVEYLAYNSLHEQVLVRLTS